MQNKLWLVSVFNQSTMDFSSPLFNIFESLSGLKLESSVDEERNIIIVEHTMAIALQFLLTFGELAAKGTSETTNYAR